jgi:hypothetical protein
MRGTPVCLSEGTLSLRPGLTRSDPDPPSSDLTSIDGVMMGQGSVGNFHIRDPRIMDRNRADLTHQCQDQMVHAQIRAHLGRMTLI